MKNDKLAKRLYSFGRLACSLLLALIVGGVVIYIAGYHPIQAYGLILKGAFGSGKALLTTLIYATPMLFTGLAFIVARSGSVLNMGLEGQLYVGAMSAALVGAYVTGLDKAVHLPLTLLAASVAGGLYSALAGYLKVRFGANDVIVTIMMNYVAQLFCGYLVAYPLRDAQGLTQTKRIAETAQLGRLVQNHSLSYAIVFGVVLILAVQYVMKNTIYGFRLRACGSNRLAAETAGVNSGRMTILTMFLSGFIVGLGGALLVTGTHFRFITNFSAGYGFEGVAVATLAGYSPIGLIASAILWGGLKSGAATVNRIASIPMDVIVIIQALVVIFVAAPKLIDGLLKPFGKIKKGANKNV